LRKYCIKDGLVKFVSDNNRFLVSFFQDNEEEIEINTKCANILEEVKLQEKTSEGLQNRLNQQGASNQVPPMITHL